MTLSGRLFLSELTLPPATEWNPVAAEWMLVRVCEGIGYCFADSVVKELHAGDALLLSRPEDAEFRASQLNDLKLIHFSLNTDRLASLLTLLERQKLAQLAQAKPRFRFFAAGPEAAARFGELKDLARDQSCLATRLRLLQFFATALAGELASTEADRGNVFPDARERFRQLMGELTEEEFWSCSVADLAGHCRCSERHFSRLFNQHFGQPIRSRQIDYRLKRAQQLLESSDTKIIDVALECGYRHLGLFNTVFKKRFGMTPSEWRRRSQQKPRPVRRLANAAGLLLVMLHSLLAPVTAQPAPGQVATNAPAFEVRRYAVEGNTLLSPAVIDKVLHDYTGPAIDLDKIRQGLTELQLAYRGRGYPTVSVTLPQQQLTNGVVKVRVVEGRLADIQVVGNNHFSSNNVLAALPSLRTNVVLNSQIFQRDLDEANANRDRQIYPVIGPGPEPGTTALTLKVKDRLPLHARFDFNNQSTPGTPALRMNYAMQYNNLWQREHQAGFQYNFSPESFRESNQLPWRFFDQPSIASYSMFYRAPITLGDGQAAANANPGDFGFDEVTRRFRPPPASGRTELLFFASRSDIDSGVRFAAPNVLTPDPFRTEIQPVGQDLTVNENLGLRLVTSLPPLGSFRQSLSFGVDFKNYRVASFNTNFALTTITTTNNSQPELHQTTTELDSRQSRNSVLYLPFTLRWDVSRPDKWGSTSFNLNNSVNVAGILDDGEAFRRTVYSAKATGTYVTAGAGLTRVQRLHEDWSLLLRADGQWANEPLLSNEQFGLGGLSGVRGYRDGQEYGDTGWRATIEPRAPEVELGMVENWPMRLRSSVFLDYGERYLLEPAPSRASTTRMLGTGFTAAVTIGEAIDFRIGAAWALRDLPGVTAGSMRIYFGLGIMF